MRLVCREFLARQFFCYMPKGIQVLNMVFSFQSRSDAIQVVDRLEKRTEIL